MSHLRILLALRRHAVSIRLGGLCQAFKSMTVLALQFGSHLLAVTVSPVPLRFYHERSAVH